MECKNNHSCRRECLAKNQSEIPGKNSSEETRAHVLALIGHHIDESVKIIPDKTRKICFFVKIYLIFQLFRIFAKNCNENERGCS